jgi:hypothetical protein
VAAVSRETGLSATTCQSVFEALARVDLFTRMNDRVFVRRRMFDALDRLDGKSIVAPRAARRRAVKVRPTFAKATDQSRRSSRL